MPPAATGPEPELPGWVAGLAGFMMLLAVVYLLLLLSERPVETPAGEALRQASASRARPGSPGSPSSPGSRASRGSPDSAADFPFLPPAGAPGERPAFDPKRM